MMDKEVVLRGEDLPAWLVAVPLYRSTAVVDGFYGCFQACHAYGIRRPRAKYGVVPSSFAAKPSLVDRHSTPTPLAQNQSTPA